MKTTTVVNVATDEFDVYIGRPSKWGNCFVTGQDGTREQVIKKHREWLPESGLLDDIHELQGKRLGCFCKPKSCHGDILAFYANMREWD